MHVSRLVVQSWFLKVIYVYVLMQIHNYIIHTQYAVDSSLTYLSVIFYIQNPRWHCEALNLEEFPPLFYKFLTEQAIFDTILLNDLLQFCTRNENHIMQLICIPYATNITRGLYTFYPLFEIYLCTVTFDLMYGQYSIAVSNQERVIVVCVRYILSR